MPSAPPRSPGNKGPPPLRAGRDLQGQCGVEWPDAGGGRGLPRAARFLQFSRPRILQGAGARSAARGERAAGGAQQGIKRRFSHSPAAQPAEKAAACELHPPSRWWRRGRAPPLPWLRALRPAHLGFFRRRWVGVGKWHGGVRTHSGFPQLLQFALRSSPLEYHIPGVQLSSEAAAFSRDPGLPLGDP